MDLISADLISVRSEDRLSTQSAFVSEILPVLDRPCGIQPDTASPIRKRTY